MAKMTLIEAIQHCEEVAQEKRYEYQECLAVHDTESAMDCKKCGEEHEQLAEWLRELKAYKEAEAEKEAQDEARREAMKLDDNEDSLKWRFNH